MSRINCQCQLSKQNHEILNFYQVKHIIEFIYLITIFKNAKYISRQTKLHKTTLGST